MALLTDVSPYDMNRESIKPFILFISLKKVFQYYFCHLLKNQASVKHVIIRVIKRFTEKLEENNVYIILCYEKNKVT